MITNRQVPSHRQTMFRPVNQINDTVSTSLKDLASIPLMNDIFKIPICYKKDDCLLKCEKPSMLIPTDQILTKVQETKPVTPSNLEYVSDITKSDVLFGQKSANIHENKKFKELLNLHRPAYVRAIKLKKSAIARQVVEEFKVSNPAGRFLRKEKESGRWYMIDDRVAAKETCKALGENMCKEEPTEKCVDKISIVDKLATSYKSYDLYNNIAEKRNKKRKLNFDINERDSISHILKNPRINDVIKKENSLRTEVNNNVLNKITGYLAANNVSMLPNLPPCQFNNISAKLDLRLGGGISHESKHHERLPRLNHNDGFLSVMKAAKTPNSHFTSTIDDPFTRAEAMRKKFYSTFSGKSKIHPNVMAVEKFSSDETLLKINNIIKNKQSNMDASRLKPLTTSLNGVIDGKSAHRPFCATKALNAFITDNKVADNGQRSTSASVMSKKSDNNDAGLGIGDSSTSSSKDEKCDEKDTSNRPDNSTEFKFVEVRVQDILCGRGGMTNNHFGNKRFRKLVDLHRQDYIDAPKIKKPDVARLIVKTIRSDSEAGRFLKKDTKTGKWYEISDRKAAEKASQALREKLHLRH